MNRCKMNRGKRFALLWVSGAVVAMFSPFAGFMGVGWIPWVLFGVGMAMVVGGALYLILAD